MTALQIFWIIAGITAGCGLIGLALYAWRCEWPGEEK